MSCEAKVQIEFGDFGAMVAFEQLELMSMLATIRQQNPEGRGWIKCNHGSDAFILTRADNPVLAASQKKDIQKKTKLLKEGKRVVTGLKRGMDVYIKAELQKKDSAASVMDDLLSVAKLECTPPISIFGDTASNAVVLFSSGTIRNEDYERIKADLLDIEAER